MGALHQLAADNAENKVSIASAGGIKPLVELAQSGSELAQRHAVGALWHLATDNDANDKSIVAAGGIPVLVGIVDRVNAASEFAAAALWDLAGDERNQVRSSFESTPCSPC